MRKIRNSYLIVVPLFVLYAIFAIYLSPLLSLILSVFATFIACKRIRQFFNGSIKQFKQTYVIISMIFVLTLLIFQTRSYFSSYTAISFNQVLRYCLFVFPLMHSTSLLLATTAGMLAEKLIFPNEFEFNDESVVYLTAVSFVFVNLFSSGIISPALFAVLYLFARRFKKTYSQTSILRGILPAMIVAVIYFGISGYLGYFGYNGFGFAVTLPFFCAFLYYLTKKLENSVPKETYPTTIKLHPALIALITFIAIKLIEFSTNLFLPTSFNLNFSAFSQFLWSYFLAGNQLNMIIFAALVLLLTYFLKNKPSIPRSSAFIYIATLFLLILIANNIPIVQNALTSGSHPLTTLHSIGINSYYFTVLLYSAYFVT